MHEIRFLPLVNEDILEAVDYLVTVLDAPAAAESLLDELDRTVVRLAQFSYSAELYRSERPLKDEIRKVPVKGFILYYAVFEDYVEIRRFLHGHRNRSDLFGE